MGLLGFVAGAVAKSVAKNVAMDATVEVADKVMPKDDEGVSIMDVPGNIDPDSNVDKAIVGAGIVIRDTLIPQKPEDYKGGVAKSTIHKWQNDNSVQHLPTVDVDASVPEPVSAGQSNKVSDTVMTLPKLVTDNITLSGSTDSEKENEENTNVKIPSFTSHF